MEQKPVNTNNIDLRTQHQLSVLPIACKQRLVA